MRFARGFGALFMVGSVACSTTASIYRGDGSIVEGSIERGGPNHITVETKYGGEQSIRRTEIREIDHPGNVHALVGGIVLGYGILNIGVGWDDCQNATDQQGAYCTGVFLPAAIGLGIMAWGLGTWIGSTNAADDVSDTSGPSFDEEEAPKPVPATLPPAPPAPSAAPAAPPPAAAPAPAPDAPAPAPTTPPADDSWAPAPAK